MFKFLRKYNKWILAVGGTLLMIVFLMPYALTQWVQQIGASGATRGSVGGETISAAEWGDVRREFAIVSRIPGGSFLPWGEEMEDERHWFLLTREAELAGLVPAVQFDADVLTLWRSNLGIGESADMIETALSKLDGVRMLFTMYQGSGKLSDRRLRDIARRRFHVANSEMFVLQADAEQMLEFEPTDEQIEEHMRAYADQLAGEGPHGFGYMLPDRVKIEWIAVAGESIRESMRNDEERFSSIAQRRYWRTHENEVGIPAVEAQAQVPQVVKDALLNELTQERSDEIARAASDMLHNSERELELRNGYYVLQDDWSAQRLPLQTVAERLRDQFPGIEIEYHARGEDWVPLTQLGSLEGVGLASTDKFGAARALTQLVSALREFNPQSALQLQAGIGLPVLRPFGDSTVYLARVLEAQRSHAPTSIDDVRDEVVRDLRRLAHFDQLVEEAPTLEQRVENEGLMPVALERGVAVQRRTPVSITNPTLLQFQLQQNQMPIAGPTPLPVVGLVENAIEKIIDHAMTLPQDIPASSLPEADRVIAVTDDEALALLVVRIIDQQPISEDLYRQLTRVGQLQGLVARDELDAGQSLAEAFNYEALVARHDLQLDNRTEDDADAAADAPDESALASGTTE